MRSFRQAGLMVVMALVAAPACSEEEMVGPEADAALLTVFPQGGATGVDPTGPIILEFTHAMMEGMEAYARDCADVATYEDWTMCHVINPQWTVRNSTAMYLGRVAEAGLIDDATSRHIAAAAGLYRAAYEAWRRTYGLLGHGVTKEQRREADRREAGAALVRDAVRQERAAIAELEKALATVTA